MGTCPNYAGSITDNLLMIQRSVEAWFNVVHVRMVRVVHANVPVDDV